LQPLTPPTCCFVFLKNWKEDDPTKNPFSNFTIFISPINIVIEQKKQPSEQSNNPMHGIKLAYILECLVDAHGWEALGSKIDIRCFKHDPSIKSSLKFLRKTPWARNKVEKLYLELIR